MSTLNKTISKFYSKIVAREAAVPLEYLYSQHSSLHNTRFGATVDLVTNIKKNLF